MGLHFSHKLSNLFVRFEWTIHLSTPWLQPQKSVSAQVLAVLEDNIPFLHVHIMDATSQQALACALVILQCMKHTASTLPWTDLYTLVQQLFSKKITSMPTQPLSRVRGTQKEYGISQD
jgi:hypothetical protein